MAFDQAGPEIPDFQPQQMKAQAPNLQGAFNVGGSGGIAPNPGQTGQNLFNILSQKANQSLSFDPTTDPIIHPQVAAGQAAYTRAANNQINDMAESSSPYATGALNTARTQAAEAAGQNTSALQAQLAQNELAARRGEVQSALSGMGGLLTADQQLALQRQLDSTNANLQNYQIQGNLDLGEQQVNNAMQLGLLNAGLAKQQMGNQQQLGLLGAGVQQQGVTNQNQQFYAGLSEQDRQFLNSLGLNYANLGLGQEQLNSANDQFAANYGLNAANQGNYWNALNQGQL